MPFYTFRHPDFASKYRNMRVITRDNPKSPKADFVPAETFDSAEGLRLIFRMSDKEWAEAQELLGKQGFFGFSLGGLLPDLPE